METFSTHHCGAYGHPEFTLRFTERRPIPVEEMLIDHLERSVAIGRRFAPGQKVQVGWAQLRLCEREDGTLGVEERDGDGWAEHCDHSLMFTWLQNEVASSLGLQPRVDFPRQDQRASVCASAWKSDTWLLSRRAPRSSEDSGWSLTCLDDQDGGHTCQRARLLVELHALAHRFAFATQFLALPVGSEVVIDGSEPFIQARIYVNGVARSPLPDSYLASRL